MSQEHIFWNSVMHKFVVRQTCLYILSARTCKISGDVIWIPVRYLFIFLNPKPTDFMHGMCCCTRTLQ